MKVDELYKLAKGTEEEDLESAKRLYQEIIDAYDYSLYSDRASSALDRLDNEVEIDLILPSATDRNIWLLMLYPFAVFTSLGPFIGGNLIYFNPFNPLLLFVYYVGIIPASLAGILFSGINIYCIIYKRKQLLRGALTGTACGFISITAIAVYGYAIESGSGESVVGLYTLLAPLSCLSGAACGWISISTIDYFSN